MAPILSKAPSWLLAGSFRAEFQLSRSGAACRLAKSASGLDREFLLLCL